MGHIVVGEPRIDRFHLFERLRRSLRERGHRVVLACSTPAARTFWRHQDGGDEVLGERTVGSFLATARPDLLLLHEDRTATSRALAATANAAGVAVLWTGAGLLPHTMQVDAEGLDGEASWTARRAADFAVVPVDESLLQTSLAHGLAGADPVALPRASVARPPRGERLRDALAAWRSGPIAAWRSFTAWRAALPNAPTPTTAPVLPAPPFVAVLLQRRSGALPAARQLVHATVRAVARAVPDASVLVVLPDDMPPRATFAGQRAVPAAAAAVAITTALATITGNHRRACLALLADTPVVHTGRAAWALPEIATPTTLAGLDDALAAALAAPPSPLRRHFLTWLLRYGHVWCSPTAPDHNGIVGLVEAIEARLAPVGAPPRRYRSGPAWPLLP